MQVLLFRLIFKIVFDQRLHILKPKHVSGIDFKKVLLSDFKKVLLSDSFRLGLPRGDGISVLNRLKISRSNC